MTLLLVVGIIYERVNTSMADKTITVYHEVTGRAVQAIVLSENTDTIRVAINGEPVILKSFKAGAYHGRVAGMDLTTEKP